MSSTHKGSLRGGFLKKSLLIRCFGGGTAFFEALLWEAEEEGRFLCMRLLQGLRCFQLQDNRKFKGKEFEAQFYAKNRLSVERWTELALSLEALSGEEVEKLTSEVRKVQRALRKMLRSQGPLRIGKVEVLTKKPKAYHKVELRLDISGAWEDPFDPEQVDIWAEVEPPKGRPYRLPAFFYLSCQRKREEEQEAVFPTGRPDFRVRFLPNDARGL